MVVVALVHLKAAAIVAIAAAVATVAAAATGTIAPLAATGDIVMSAAMPPVDNDFAILAAVPKQLVAAAVSAAMLEAKAEEGAVSLKIGLLQDLTTA